MFVWAFNLLDHPSIQLALVFLHPLMPTSKGFVVTPKGVHVIVSMSRFQSSTAWAIAIVKALDVKRRATTQALGAGLQVKRVDRLGIVAYFTDEALRATRCALFPNMTVTQSNHLSHVRQ
jgi:hypothetical protein